MRTAILLAVIVVCSAFGAVDLSKPIAELKLTDGRTLRNVLIVGYAQNAVTAKWDGGRGTIAYKLFPDEYGEDLERSRPKPPPPSAPPVKKSSPPAASRPVQKSPLESITSSNFGVKEIEAGDIIARWSWQTTLTNICGDTIAVRPIVRLSDAESFNLEEYRGEVVVLKGGENKTISESTITKAAVWAKAAKYTLTLELVN